MNATYRKAGLGLGFGSEVGVTDVDDDSDAAADDGADIFPPPPPLPPLAAWRAMYFLAASAMASVACKGSA